MDLTPGGKMVFTWDNNSHHALVERVEPPAFFSYRWARPAGEPPVEGNSTLVEYTLTEAGPATVLRVVESGFGSLRASEQDKETAVQENVQSWRNELGELRQYAEAITS